MDEIKITIPKPSKVHEAWAIWWLWLHEVYYEFEENADPSWKDYTKKTFARIIELRAQMTDEEKQELEKRMYPFKNITGNRTNENQ